MVSYRLYMLCVLMFALRVIKRVMSLKREIYETSALEL